MVSIIPRVDLFGNTVVDWICKLSYFRLDTLCNTYVIMQFIVQGHISWADNTLITISFGISSLDMEGFGMLVK